MGSKLKKIRSLNLNKKLFFVGAFLSVGFLGTLVLNKFIEDSYNARKSELEFVIGKFLNKKVELGDYSGIRFLGISLSNSKIIDKLDINSGIRVKTTFVGIMPIKSFINQKWIFDIRPKKTNINIKGDFFSRNNSKNYQKKINKNKIKYDLNFNLNEFVNFKVNDLGIDTRVKGNIIYKPNSTQIIGITRFISY